MEKEQGVNNYDDQTIMGIQFKIKNKMLETNNISVLKLITDVLDYLGVIENKVFYIFKSNTEYDKILYNKSGYFGDDKSKYYLKTNRNSYRLYNQHSRSLLSLVK